MSQAIPVDTRLQRTVLRSATHHWNERSSCGIVLGQERPDHGGCALIPQSESRGTPPGSALCSAPAPQAAAGTLIQLAPIFLELPSVDAAARHAQVDAGGSGEFVPRMRFSAPREVGRRAGLGEAGDRLRHGAGGGGGSGRRQSLKYVGLKGGKRPRRSYRAR
jgi:hypothetical protein